MHSPSAALLAALFLASIAPAQAPATASAAEWIDLFDGKTLKGWRQLNGTASYAVRDGVIVGTTAKGSPNSFLCSEEFYGNYELEFETKLFDDALNSGVQIRSHSYPTYRKGRVHGYQVEVSTNGNAGFIYDEARRRWLSKKRSDKKAFKNGDWNRYRVVCHGSSIRTWINGVPIAELDDSMTATGFIALQVHSVKGDPGWRVAWRNIRLRPIGDGGGWKSLFNGKDLTDWKVNENPESVKVQDGAIVVGGKRAHVFYAGPAYSHSFKNFEFKAEVMTKPGANSGIYFHTLFQDSGWPSKGYEVQVNNTQGDWRRTGGLYAVQDVREAPAKDDQWFEMHVTVRGKHIVVKVDGKATADYVEPPRPERQRNMKDRLVSRGTFAFQCHDPGSVVHYKDIRVKLLPEHLGEAKAAEAGAKR